MHACKKTQSRHNQYFSRSYDNQGNATIVCDGGRSRNTHSGAIEKTSFAAIDLRLPVALSTGQTVTLMLETPRRGRTIKSRACVVRVEQATDGYRTVCSLLGSLSAQQLRDLQRAG